MREIIPRWVVFEGLDGAGTTTQMHRISQRLAQTGRKVQTTCEPTDGPMGKLTREIMGHRLQADPRTLAYLFAADRNEHVFGKGGILEATRKENIVLCDRYLASSLAYQSPLCGWDLIHELNSRFPLPELLIYLDISPHTGEERMKNRGDEREIFENLPYQTQVREYYEKALKSLSPSGMRIVRIDGHQKPEKITEEIWSLLPL